jgi:signal transduction histidine kinase
MRFVARTGSPNATAGRWKAIRPGRPTRKTPSPSWFRPGARALHGPAAAAACAKKGIASLAFIPIAHQGRLLGKFMLYFNARTKWRPEAEVRLALTVAEYLALAVSRQRAVEELQPLNADLEDAGAPPHPGSWRKPTAKWNPSAIRCRTTCARRCGRSTASRASCSRTPATSSTSSDKENLRRIIAASERMGRLMDDLLKLSRIGRASMRLADVDLSALAAESPGACAGQARNAGWRMQIAAGLRVRADSGLMRIALENLLGNAWKYTGGNSRDAASNSAGTEDGKVYFVRDNGAGFDMRYATKLFSPFQRAHSHGEFEGNGIGLAIVQRIVHRHGGRIWAESEPGRGSTFCFTLWPEGIPAELACGFFSASSPPA